MAGVTRSLDAANSYAGNYPSYDSAGTSKFTPQLFSKKMLRNFYQTTAFSEISNTDYEGEIGKVGDSVIIRTTPVVAISAYTVGQTLTYEVPESANISMTIDKAYSWSFRMDDIDAFQTDLDLVNKFTADAGERMKINIDTECFNYISTLPEATNKGNTAGAISGNIALGAVGSPVTVTSTNATDLIVDVNLVLDEANIPDADRFLVLPAWYIAMLKKGDLKSADITGDATGVIRTGVVGMIDRTKIIQSNLLKTQTDTVLCTSCMGGTREAVTFASQITKSESIRIPDSFGDYMRGLAVYGRAVVQPKALVCLYVRK